MRRGCFYDKINQVNIIGFDSFMKIKIIKEPIKKNELVAMANEKFGNLVKAVVDVRQGIMAIGGELHADEEVVLSEECDSKREDTWGVNLYPLNNDSDFIEFDSMINLKPAYGNRTRGIENPETRKKIEEIIKELIIE
jgi:hypothetical protein